MDTTSPVIVEVPEILPVLENIEEYTALSADASVLMACILVFFLVVVLCYFVYKFFRIFF